MKYIPQTPFQITEDGTLIYNLKEIRDRRGNPQMVNDIEICFGNRFYGVPEGAAEAIRDALNAAFPVPLTEDDKRGILVDIEQQKRDQAEEVVWVQTH